MTATDRRRVCRVADGGGERTGGRGPRLAASIDWQQVEDDVRRLRQRIFTASQAGDLKKVRNLQKLMLRSRANTLLSVRRVTEINAGRKTAGVDGKVVLLASAEGRAGRLGAAAGSTRWTASAGQAGVHPEGQREAAPARDSGDRRPGAAGAGRQRAGTGVGSAVRAEVLWLPAGPRLPRRDRGHLHHGGGPQPAAAVGARRGPGGGVRPDRPRPSARRTRRVPRQGLDRASG